MAKTSRRNLLKGVAAGSVAAGLGLTVKPATATPKARVAGAQHEHQPINGPLATATVSFGQWQTSPPLDRFPNASPRFHNQHQLIPYTARIKAGGSVNFIIAGLHQVIVYDDGTQPSDINTAITVAPTNQPMPLLIADPNRMIYRGLDPSTQSQDRVEVVHFPHPGTYLVICGVLPHFVEGMFGFVRVLH